MKHETAKDYIKNRICYEETDEDKTYTLTPKRDNDTWNFTNGDIPLILGQSATVKSFGGISSTFVGTVTQDSDGKLCIDATSVIPITIYSNTATYNYSWIGNTGLDYVTVTISSTVVHQIDPKFIPIDTTLSSTSENAVQNKVVKAAIDEVMNMVEEYIGSKVSDKELILFSSTENSTKKFKITVNDSGTISAKEVTEGA